MIPVLECVYVHGDGTYTTRFGHHNKNATAVTIEKGFQNRFTPSPADRNQPEHFLPGRIPAR